MNGFSIARCQRLVSRSLFWQALFLGGCLMLMLGLAYSVHLRGLFFEIKQGAVQSRHLQTEQAPKALQAQALISLKAQLAASHERLGVSRWHLAAGGELADLLEDIANEAQERGVFVEQLELLAEIQHDQYIEMPIQVQLRGAYEALAAFVHGLAQFPRLVTQHNFSLLAAQRSGPSGLGMQLHISLYRSSEPTGLAPRLEPRPATAAPTFSRSPFEPSSRVQPRQHLETLSLDQFEMVGSLARRQARFVLLNAAGAVHRLQVGDRIGRDRGRIVRIEERQVEIAEDVFVAGKGWVERRRMLRMKLPADAG